MASTNENLLPNATTLAQIKQLSQVKHLVSVAQWQKALLRSDAPYWRARARLSKAGVHLVEGKETSHQIMTTTVKLLRLALPAAFA
jgi:hypothetical protein